MQVLCAYIEKKFMFLHSSVLLSGNPKRSFGDYGCALNLDAEYPGVDIKSIRFSLLNKGIPSFVTNVDIPSLLYVPGIDVTPMLMANAMKEESQGLLWIGHELFALYQDGTETLPVLVPEAVRRFFAKVPNSAVRVSGCFDQNSVDPITFDVGCVGGIDLSYQYNMRRLLQEVPSLRV